jgi:two-component system, LytTR family, response regulator
MGTMNLTAQDSIRTVLVDDEPVERKILGEQCATVPGVEIVGEAGNGQEAIRKIRSLKPDLVLLELEMPGMDGFDVIARLDGPTLPCIVLLTAHDQHAFRAFEAGAMDYILKPATEDRLAQSIERVRRFRKFGLATDESRNGAPGSGRAGSYHRPQKIVGKIGEEYFLIESGQVLAFEVEDDMVWIITHKQRYIAAQSLSVIEQKVAGLNFVRIHRKSLVNLDHVIKISPLSSHRWLLTLNNQQEFTVSKRQARSIRSFLSW